MPGYDGTGPMGAGPMTGWGRGFCFSPVQGTTPYLPFYGRPVYGYGFGRPRMGLGLRRGWGGRGRGRWCW
ncbi:MAG TPA: hypothetical protein DCD97_02175 [Firmicutes bacterium]|jgi:hypothetical protein|nr:DUF5320 domain-containing protein [Bacillota bacterium]HAA34099.1 hypothetical protein [Bacillota bacterium]